MATTRADELRNEIKEDLEQAIRILKSASDKMYLMIDKKTWGGDQWSLDFEYQVMDDIIGVTKCSTKLIKINKKYR